MHVTQEITSLNEARQRGLSYIPEEGMFLKSGETVVMEADGYPLIISAGGSEMMVVHTKETRIVDVIIDTFKELGVPPIGITMSIQMYAPEDRGGAFVEEARIAGVRHVWAMCTIGEFLTHAKVSIGKRSFITIRRDD